MTKGRIKSICNLPNLLWLSIVPSKESLKIVDTIVRQIDKGYPGKEGFMNQNVKTKYKNLIPLVNYHVSDLSSPPSEGCYAITVFLENQAFFILLKNHPLFKKVEKIFFSLFEFSDNNTR